MKKISSRRAKACGISEAVRTHVFERDLCICFNCGVIYPLTPAHVVSRANGGLGIEQNIVTACISCHDKMDHGTRAERDALYDKARDYLRRHYPDLDEINVRYSKYGN